MVLQISPDFVSFMHIVSVALGWETRSLTVQCYIGLKPHRTGLGMVDVPQVCVVVHSAIHHLL